LLRQGRRLAVDVGKARIGLAVSDFHGILASPFQTLKRLETLEESIRDLLDTCNELGELLEIYVGLPLNLKGAVTISTSDALEFAEELTSKTAVPVYLIDERLTTSLANSQLKLIGKSQREARSSIDQMAAVAILEYAMSKESASGQVPGVFISDWKSAHE